MLSSVDADGVADRQEKDMSTSPESIAVGQPRRVSRVWKIVAAVVLAIVAVPVTVGVGSWAANQLATPSKDTPSIVKK
jgi:hypothetical protein